MRAGAEETVGTCVVGDAGTRPGCDAPPASAAATEPLRGPVHAGTLMGPAGRPRTPAVPVAAVVGVSADRSRVPADADGPERRPALDVAPAPAGRAEPGPVAGLSGRRVAPAPAAPPPATGAGRCRAPGSAAAAPRARFVVLGDSLSEGVGDRVAGGWRGWAALLAQALRPGGEDIAFTNLAVSGAQSRDVVETQLPAALALRPQLASVVVGVNDTLRRTFDIGRLARRLDRVCGELTAAGAVVLTACLPDPGRMLGLPGPLARPLARRQRAVNAVVHALSERYDAVHLHLDGPRWTEDRALWSADRLHPGERGHRAVAGAFHRLLEERGLALGPAPSPEPEQPPPTRTDAALWLATAGTAWVVRRCGDLLPQLLGLAAAELRHSAAGTVDLLDARAERALVRALRAVGGPATPSGPRPGGGTTTGEARGRRPPTYLPPGLEGLGSPEAEAPW